jgi:hypothetical protein
MNPVNAPHLARLVVLPILLAACAPRPARVATRSSGIDLAPITLTEADPAVREACENSVHRALIHRGFIVDASGPHVEVEASFWRNPDLGATSSSYDLDVDTLLSSGATASSVARLSSYTADLTATIHFGLRSIEVMSSGAAVSVEQVGSLRPKGGSSRSSACDAAAERLATAMVDVLNAP